MPSHHRSPPNASTANQSIAFPRQQQFCPARCQNSFVAMTLHTYPARREVLIVNKFYSFVDDSRCHCIILVRNAQPKDLLRDFPLYSGSQNQLILFIFFKRHFSPAFRYTINVRLQFKSEWH